MRLRTLPFQSKTSYGDEKVPSDELRFQQLLFIFTPRPFTTEFLVSIAILDRKMNMMETRLKAIWLLVGNDPYWISFRESQ